MKRLVVIAVLGFLAATAAAAETAAEVIVSGIMSEIRETQHLPANGRIDCDKVTPGQYERLGIAVMDLTYPDTADHAWIDNMMGGPTTEMARAMHRMVGARYLGCPYGGRAGYFFGWPGMMGYGPGMMGGWYRQRSGSAPFLAVGLLVCILLVVVIVMLATRSSARAESRLPLDILRQRYAKGEINREQYEAMKKDLTT